MGDGATAVTLTPDELRKMTEGVQFITEKTEKLEKQYDGLDVEAINKTKDTVIDIQEQLQKKQQEAKAVEEEVKKTAEALIDFKTTTDALTKEIARMTAKPAEKGNKFAEYENAFSRYLRKGALIDSKIFEPLIDDYVEKTLYGVTPDGKDVDILRKELMSGIKDMAAGSNATGGFWLTPDRTSRISERVFETSPVRSIATVVSTTAGTWEMTLDDDSAGAGWVGEVSDRPNTTTPNIGLITIPIQEMYARPRQTQTLIDDAGFDVAGWLEQKVSRDLTRLENTAFVTGDGARKPKGFLSFPAWAVADTYERDAVEQLETASASVIVADDLIFLQGKLISDYDMGAVWGMKRKTLYENIFTLKDDNIGYLINPRIVAEGGELVLLGKPIILMDDMPVVADAALPIVYGNFRDFYTVVDRFGIRVLRDPFTENPYIRFNTTKRVGAGVTNWEAGKILKIKAA